MSKAGDTIEDFLEDGVTPTPRHNRMNKQKENEDDEESSDLKEFQLIIQTCD